MDKFNKTQYVELLAQPGQAQIQFTPQTYLNNKKTLSLETYSSNDVTTSKSNYPIATPAIIKTCFLTLYCSDINQGYDSSGNGKGMGQWIRGLPLWNLHRIQTGTDPYVKEIFELMGQIIVWEESFLETTNTALITVPTVFLFNVGYF